MSLLQSDVIQTEYHDHWALGGPTHWDLKVLIPQYLPPHGLSWIFRFAEYESVWDCTRPPSFPSILTHATAHLYIHTSKHVCVHIYLSMYVCMYVRMYVCMYVYAYIHIKGCPMSICASCARLM